ncbi:unnamed protein product [Rotaria sp. Silwood1]|nr:unnamed protein product [Rotaria sp. Silwood1]
MSAITTTTTNFVQFFFIIFVLSVFLLINETSAAAGHCYQCNSRNPLCGVNVSATLKIDGTPCNGLLVP